MTDLNELPADAGILICGHGSRAHSAAREFALLADGLRRRHRGVHIEHGFLEYSAPNIHMALDRLVEAGARRIYAVPGMLFRATHAKNDIPSVLTTYMDTHPGVQITYGRELGLHPEMINAFQSRILAALDLAAAPEPGALYDTMLVTVGRGTSVASANAEAAKLCRIVTENLGFGWSETVYSGVTFPSVGAGLAMAARLGFKRIVVAPYFLFSGRLIGRIRAYVDRAAAEHPDIEFLSTDYLRDDPHVINTFEARIVEMLDDTPQPGLMQDFRERLARGEVSVHHHHAEFQPDGHHAADHHHHHDLQGEAHHHHAPYRHIAHPFGPRTMIDENVCCCFMSQFPQEVIDEERARRAAAGMAPAEGTPQCKVRGR